MGFAKSAREPESWHFKYQGEKHPSIPLVLLGISVRGYSRRFLLMLIFSRVAGDTLGAISKRRLHVTKLHYTLQPMFNLSYYPKQFL